MLNEQIGIDKTVIANFAIVSLKPSILCSKDNVDFIVNKNSLLKSNNNIGIDKLKITDSYFGKLECGMSKANPKKINKPFTKLTVSVSDKDNLQNLTVDEYKKRIEQVFNYINKTYGIVIRYDYEKLYILYIEINLTFALINKFKDYERALLILMSNLPSKYKRKKNVKLKTFYDISENNNDKSANIETLAVKNSSVELIIYNKTKQLKDSQDIDLQDDYIRIEYKLKRRDSYINTLGGTVGSLTDKKIKDMFLKLFSEDIMKPYFETYKNKGNYLYESELKPLLQGSKRQWYKDFIRKVRKYEQENNLPMIIDITDIFPMLKQYSKHNYSRRKKMVLSNAEKSEKDLINVYEKINEILDKVKSFTD